MKCLLVSGCLLLTALLGPLAAHSQAPEVGCGPPVGWIKLSAETRLHGRLGLLSEVETRQSNSQLSAQYLGRVGLRWHLSRCFSLGSGYVLAYNEPQPGDRSFLLPEHRLYQELNVADAGGFLRVGHRLRAEERWLRTQPEAAFRFMPRLRYQLRLVVPLHKGGKLPVGSSYLLAADEVFVGLGRRDGGSRWEENRASIGVGYRASQRLRVELAYLYQTQASGVAGGGLARSAVQCTLAQGLN